LVETLKIPDEALFGSESPYDSLMDAVTFWREWLHMDTVWSEFRCSQIYDEVVQGLIEDIDHLNLTYKTEKEESVVHYVAHNTKDQQFLVRISNFLEIFLI
jgi:hypothetical protein